MTDIYGINFSSKLGKLAPGSRNDARLRHHDNVTDLAVEGGGTSNPIIVAQVREGQYVTGASLASDADLSGRNYSLGTDADPVKYAAAVAGPAANASVTFFIKVAARKAGALTVPETIKLFPSGNMPASGNVYGSVTTSGR